MPATISSFRTLKAGQSAIAPHQRASGWSVHPSNPAPTPQSSDSPGPVLPFDSLRSIASGLAWALRAVPDDNGDRATARSVRLIATSLYDIWLITWPDGATLGPHDHGGARSVLHMVEGELIETYADRSEAWPSRVRVLRAATQRVEEPPSCTTWQTAPERGRPAFTCIPPRSRTSPCFSGSPVVTDLRTAGR